MVDFDVTRVDLVSHTLDKYGLEFAVTPDGEKTLQEAAKRYPLEREYVFVIDSHGNGAAILKS